MMCSARGQCVHHILRQCIRKIKGLPFVYSRYIAPSRESSIRPHSRVHVLDPSPGRACSIRRQVACALDPSPVPADRPVPPTPYHTFTLPNPS